MLINCCSEVTSVSWFTIWSGLMAFVGSCACNSAVSNEIKRFEFDKAVLVKLFELLLVLDVDAVAWLAAADDAIPFVCMALSSFSSYFPTFPQKAAPDQARMLKRIPGKGVSNDPAWAPGAGAVISLSAT